MKILYVEDHAVFAGNVIRQFLSGHTVIVVPTIEEAREQIALTTFDLFLVDYDLADSKGDALVREIRASGNSKPIIAASSHEQGNKALLEAGASAVCSKMHFETIQTVIEQCQAGLIGP